MSILILGILLWVLPHLFKRLAPRRHLMMMPQIKAMVAGFVLVGVVLMVIGYRMADVVPIYSPLPGMGHANNTLMLISIYLFGVSGARSVLIDKIRHPMLWGMVIWSVSHLLVNGDLSSIVLFGALGLWAVGEMVLINRAGPWKRPKPGKLLGDLKNLIGTALVYGVITWIHSLLGHNPFLGSY
ncbi:NnrU protein [Rhodobacter aestuarii]|uniref:NnrU protein n=1 Tax=Rhodobacter aestuarii TaxID=453582 RepID=A0A1N7JP99_9RHOB|nr:NnrU family protein [Rhodobacter aestuarii]PTV96047.1 NnrU protein [Rhodobacter aestuarii]SIS51135.1 NnrU protein [Rhodobacter aestuarii]